MILALSGTMLVSCTQSEYVGEAVQQGMNDAIAFGGGAGRMTRATGEDAATLLDNQMKVYGVKQTTAEDATAGTTAAYSNVFVDYSVKYDASKTANDEYNNGWYYVGAETGQTIKYWDYASADYRFVAGSPVENFTFTPGTDGSIATATVTGLGGRLNRDVTTAVGDAVYIADPVVVAKADYQNPVTFTFKTQQSKVRVGIYETINGYEVSAIQFYNNAATPVASNYITLNSETDNYFQGGTVSGTVTYDWTTSPASYTFAYGTDATLEKGNYWEGGLFEEGVPATSSADAIASLYGKDDDYDANTGYFVVLQTPVATAAPLTILCDYTLTSTDGSGETINVKGAKATIPAAYTKWEANKAYTYLFKITKDTNGTTGPDGPEGLYPITFDAVVVDVADAFVGTETTVTTPSITVAQKDAATVEDNGIIYQPGAVEVTAMEGTADVTTDYTWSYMTLTGAFDYTKGYEDQEGTWSTGKLATVEASKTYLIKATKTDAGDPADPEDDVTTTAYFVLVVSAAESN